MGEPDNGNAGQPAAASMSSTTGSSIDIEKLVEKVYRLMREDARLDRARGKMPRQGTRNIRR